MAASVQKRPMSLIVIVLVLVVPLVILLASVERAHAEEGDLTAGCSHVWTYDDNESYGATYLEKGRKVWYCENCYAERVKVIPKKKVTKAAKRASKPVLKFYKYAKEYNASMMGRCFKKKPKDGLFVKMRYMADICKKQNSKRMKCKLVDGRIGKKRATFTVKVLYRSGYDAFCKGMRAYYKAGVRYALRNGESPSDSWMETQSRKYITKYVNKMGFENTWNTFDIKVVKTKSGWKITKLTWDMKDSVNCDYDSAWSDTDI